MMCKYCTLPPLRDSHFLILRELGGKGYYAMCWECKGVSPSWPTEHEAAYIGVDSLCK